MVRSLEEQLHESWLKIRQSISPDIESAILPITTTSRKYKNEPYEYVGSSFLLAVADRKYIVTAKHVIDEALKGGVFTLNSENKFFLMDFDNEYHAFFTERYDFAVIDVTKSEEFTTRTFIQYKDGVEIKELDRVYVCGFPVSKNKSIRYEGILAPLGLLLRIVQPTSEFLSKGGINPEGCMFFDYTSNKFVNDDATNVDKILSPKGLSGGPIFWIGDIDQILKGSESQIQCIGVFTNRKDDLAWGLSLSNFIHDVVKRSR